MPPSAAENDARWAAWLLERNRRGFRTLLFIVAGLYPAFAVLDLLVAPREALPWLLGTRFIVTAVTLALFPLHGRRALDRHADRLASAYMLLCAGGISIMTVFLGGLASPYYAGLTLAIVATGLLFVWPPAIVVGTHSLIVATFLVMNVATGPIESGFAAVSNLFFLSSTALIAALGQTLGFQTARDQHEQRMRLEAATARVERAHAELQQLERFKSQFFANITHELRTPLTMILTPLELLLHGEMGKFGETAASSFQSMYRSALKLLKLINDLLDLARLEESRLRLRVAEHELVGYLKALVDQTQVLARRRELALAFRTTDPEIVLRCDLERLERVFVNLLANAIKFTQSGGRVEVSLAARPDEIEVVVQDDGPGFPPDEAEKIFERFYQAEMDGTRRHGGAGIGLGLARQLVELHGGTLLASSDGRRGARFTVRIPRRRSFHEGELATPEPGEEPSGGDLSVQVEGRHEFRLIDIDEATDRRIVDRDAGEERRRYTVVVVEDDPRVLRVVHMSLRRQFRVVAAADGLKGLELATRERPNLVVTDLMMPGIDGLELTRRLRAEASTSHIPILMLSARGEVEARVKGLETGVSAYLGKPFSPRELVSTARRLVQAEEETAGLVLERRMESVEIVTAGLAHELNNPLNYVKNALARVGLDAGRAIDLAALAKERPLDPAEAAQVERSAARVREMLEVAAAGLRRIAGTVELMSRYGRAGFRRETSTVDAWEAVRTVASVVLPATGRKVTLALAFEGDGALACVLEEFQQVVTNLLQNAIEVVADGSGHVWVSGREEGNDLVLSVKDDGPGMPPEVRDRVFTPFFTTKGPGRGMGLGLTIVRRVVDAHGGALHLTTAPGAGTEFVVRLPRRGPPDLPPAGAGAGGRAAAIA